MSDPGSQPPPPPGGGTPPPPPPAATPPPPAAAPPPPGAAPAPPGGYAQPSPGYPPTPGYGVPGASGSADRSALAARNRMPGIIALVGAIVLAIATALPWATFSGDLSDIPGLSGDTITGWSTSEGDTGDGPIFVVLAIAIAVMAVLALRGIVNLGTKIATIVVAAIALLIGFAEFGDVSDANDIVKPFGFEFTYGAGLWLLLLGAALGIVGGALFKRTA